MFTPRRNITGAEEARPSDRLATAFEHQLSPEGKIMDFESNDTVGGYAVPVDPMDLLQCDSCQ